jgi:dipeptidyl aminopeptidase/acylaminoacyl peptidase
VWFAVADGGSSPSYAWRAPLEASEQLVDVSWSPRADQLLVVSHATQGGGAQRSRVWLLDSDGQHAQPLLSLPSNIAPGSEAWSADGRAIAFVAHTGHVNALCLVRSDGDFRYIADLDPSAQPPRYPPVAWSLDNQSIAFVAPYQHPPGSTFNWLQPDSRHAIYVERVDQPLPQALGDTDADLLSWREDGQLLGLGRANAEGPLEVRLLSGNGGGQALLDLPLRTPGSYAALWDSRHARMLIASQALSSSAIDYWLVNLGLEASL